MRCDETKPLWESFLYRFLKSHCFLTENSAPQETPLLRSVKPAAWLAKCSCLESKFHCDAERRDSVPTLTVLCSKMQSVLDWGKLLWKSEGFQSDAQEARKCKKEWMAKACSAQSTGSLWKNLERTLIMFGNIFTWRSVKEKLTFKFLTSFGSICLITASKLLLLLKRWKERYKWKYMLHRRLFWV